MIQLIRVSNPEIDSICKNGFKGVYLIAGTELLSFQHELGGVNCELSIQKIINTILKLRLSEEQKIGLLTNVEFIEREASILANTIFEATAFNNSLHLMAEMLNVLEMTTGLDEEKILSLVVSIKRNINSLDSMDSMDDIGDIGFM